MEDIFEAIAAFIESFLAGGAEGSFVDAILSGGAEAGLGEGIWGAMRGFAAEGADIYLDVLWYDMMIGKGEHTRNQFQSFFKRNTQQFTEFREVACAHGLLHTQLKNALKNDAEKYGALLSEYEALGAQLPSDALLTRIKHGLSKIYHPDNPNSNEELLKNINEAIDTLGKGPHRERYQSFLNTIAGDSGKETALFNFIKEHGAQRGAPTLPRGLLNSGTAEEGFALGNSLMARMGHAYEAASTARKVSVVAGAGIGGLATLYAAIKTVDRVLEKKHETPTPRTEQDTDASDALPNRKSPAHHSAAFYAALTLVGLAATTISLNHFRLSGGPIR